MRVWKLVGGVYILVSSKWFVTVVFFAMEIDMGQAGKLTEREKRRAQKKLHRQQQKIRKLEKAMEKAEHEHDKAEEVTEEEKESKKTGRRYTVSIALPGSILDNAQSPELRTYLAGQIARAAVIFQVDEIVIFDEEALAVRPGNTDGEYKGIGKQGECNVQLARILQYLECPQYLRKSFFPKHRDLQYAGLLNPLDSPHHMRADDEAAYREGVVLDRPVKAGCGSYVDCGLLKPVQIDQSLRDNVRVTVRLDCKSKKRLRGVVVPPTAPRTRDGLYWGYTVRLAASLGAAIAECPYTDTGRYDLTVGTSERGKSVDGASLPAFKHLLVVFGGVKGLESSLEGDELLAGIDDPCLLFDHYFNTCPQQGSRTIRTEEAILVTMSTLRPIISQNVTPC